MEHNPLIHQIGQQPFLLVINSLGRAEVEVAHALEVPICHAEVLSDHQGCLRNVPVLLKYTLSFSEFNSSCLISFTRASLTAVSVTEFRASWHRYLNLSTGSESNLKGKISLPRATLVHQTFLSFHDSF
jgi:hypothetical protein